MERLTQRTDLTVVARSTTTADLDAIIPDVVVDNSSDVDELRSRLHRAIEEIV